MTPSSKRRNAAAQALVHDVAWTLIGPGSLVQGDLVLKGDVMIHGRIEGTIATDGHALVAAGGSVEGGLRARTVVVEGICRGILEGTDRVEVRLGALVQADVIARFLFLDEGARFSGRRIAPSDADPRTRPFQMPSPGRA